MENFPKPITKLCIKKILEQMNDSFYQVINKEGKKGRGFFCYLKHLKKNIPFLITNSDIINNIHYNSIKISKNDFKKEIEVGDTIYVNEVYNISIIQIKRNSIEGLFFLELDDKLYEEESETYYYKDSIYIIQCKDGNEDDISVTYGIINNINNSQINYYSQKNSKGALIFNLDNNKLIGMHESYSLNFNKALFFKFIINELQACFGKKFIFKNEINIKIEIKNESEINKKIYFLDNYDYDDNEGINHYHDNLKELNSANTKLYINDDLTEYQKFFKPDKLGVYNIKIKFCTNLKDCSYMFAGCKNIVFIDFHLFNTKNVTNMKYMFYKCLNLKNINLFNFNSNLVTDMSYMFSYCYKLENLDLTSFNTENVNNLSNMFNSCWNLKYLNISFFNIKNVTNMDNIFSGCSNLNELYLPSFYKYYNELINKYNQRMINEIEITTIRILNIKEKIYFIYTDELNESNTELYINNKKTKYKNFFKPEEKGVYTIKLKFNCNLTSCNHMFKSLYEISEIKFIYFNTKYISDMSYMFDYLNLNNLDLSCFDTRNVKNMEGMFYSCHFLKKIDLSSFDTKSVTNMGMMFYECYVLYNLDLSSFDMKNVSYKSGMFGRCTKTLITNLLKPKNCDEEFIL